MSKLITFFKSRPTETWLGLWLAIVAAFQAFDVSIEPGVVAAVSAVIGWLVTFVASRDSNSLGPS